MCGSASPNLLSLHLCPPPLLPFPTPMFSTSLHPPHPLPRRYVLLPFLSLPTSMFPTSSIPLTSIHQRMDQVVAQLLAAACTPSLSPSTCHALISAGVLPLLLTLILRSQPAHSLTHTRTQSPALTPRLASHSPSLPQLHAALRVLAALLHCLSASSSPGAAKSEWMPILQFPRFKAHERSASPCSVEKWRSKPWRRRSSACVTCDREAPHQFTVLQGDCSRCTMHGWAAPPCLIAIEASPLVFHCPTLPFIPLPCLLAEDFSRLLVSCD